MEETARLRVVAADAHVDEAGAVALVAAGGGVVAGVGGGAGAEFVGTVTPADRCPTGTASDRRDSLSLAPWVGEADRRPLSPGVAPVASRRARHLPAPTRRAGGGRNKVAPSARVSLNTWVSDPGRKS